MIMMLSTSQKAKWKVNFGTQPPMVLAAAQTPISSIAALETCTPMHLGP
jgi:hypothetical protein